MRFERDEYAVPNVVEDFAPVRLLARRNIAETGARHSATVNRRTEHSGEVMNPRRREREPVIGTIEARSICDSGHFDGRLRAVRKGIVELRIEPVFLDHLLAPPEQAPHGVWR